MSKKAKKIKSKSNVVVFAASGLSVDAQVRESILKMRDVAIQIASPPASMMGAAMPSPYMIQMANDGSADVYIYGDIGESWYDDSVTAKGFIDQIDALDSDEIRVRISSYGGSVKDGIAIHNAIRRHDAITDVYIDSVAMSSASLIAMSGDTVHMVDNGLLMIHAPWSYAVGNSKDMRESADTLDIYATAMATSYSRKSSLTRDDALALLTDGADHYYTAEEAKALGFIDTIVESDDSEAAASALAPVLSSRYADGVLNFIGRDLPAVAASLNPTGPGNEEESDMPLTPEEKAAAAKKHKAEVLAAEQTRRGSIRELFSKFKDKDGVQAILDACLDDVKCEPSAASDKLLAHLGSQSEPVAAVAGQIEMGTDAHDKFRAGAESSIIMRAGGKPDNDSGNEMRGMDLKALAVRSLVLAGVSMRQIDAMDREGLMRMAAAPVAFGGHTSSDFPNILSNVATKFMLIGQEQAEETYPIWTREQSLSDFRLHDMDGLSEFSNLEQVLEGGEYKHGDIIDYKEGIKLAKYGKMFSIAWEALLADDLNAFTMVPRRMGMAAARKMGDLAYAVLIANANMRDGTALFHADHSNLDAAGAAPTTAAVDKARTAMGTQKGELDAANLNISPAFMLTPKALEGQGNVVRSAENEVDLSAKDSRLPNSVKDTFEVVADSRLDVAPAAWYMAANPNTVDTVIMGVLNGESGATLTEVMKPEIDGVTFKIRQVGAAKAGDWRGLWKNPGS